MGAASVPWARAAVDPNCPRVYGTWLPAGNRPAAPEHTVEGCASGQVAPGRRGSRPLLRRLAVPRCGSAPCPARRTSRALGPALRTLRSAARRLRRAPCMLGRTPYLLGGDTAHARSDAEHARSSVAHTLRRTAHSRSDIAQAREDAAHALVGHRARSVGRRAGLVEFLPTQLAAQPAMIGA